MDSSGDQESQLLARAHEAAAAEDHASAVAHYRHLVALHPRCIYFVCLGLAFSDLGRHEEAEAAVREGLALEPDSWLAWRQLAWAFRDQGRMDEAFQACERSLAVHAKAGRLTPARVHAEEARRLGFVDAGFETLLETTLDWLRDVDRKYHPRTHRSRPARGDAAG